jgi:hypothetical protein
MSANKVMQISAECVVGRVIELHKGHGFFLSSVGCLQGSVPLPDRAAGASDGSARLRWSGSDSFFWGQMQPASNIVTRKQAADPIMTTGAVGDVVVNAAVRLDEQDVMHGGVLTARWAGLYRRDSAEPVWCRCGDIGGEFVKQWAS